MARYWSERFAVLVRPWPSEADAILIRTGWGKFRTEDVHRYTQQNPGFGPDAADFLLMELPRLRGVFSDIISCCAFEDQEPGVSSTRKCSAAGEMTASLSYSKMWTCLEI